MSVSFKAATSQYQALEKPLQLINCSVIMAAIMFRGTSGPRLMAALIDQTTQSYGFSESDFQTCALMAKAILNGLDGESKYESQLLFLKEACPGYPFTLKDTDWFSQNINIIVEVIDTSLNADVELLSK